MSSIKINDIAPAGADLLLDSEGYLDDLTDNELGSVNGQTLTLSVSIGPSYSWSYSQGSWSRGVTLSVSIGPSVSLP